MIHECATLIQLPQRFALQISDFSDVKRLALTKPGFFYSVIYPLFLSHSGNLRSLNLLYNLLPCSCIQTPTFSCSPPLLYLVQFKHGRHQSPTR